MMKRALLALPVMAIVAAGCSAQASDAADQTVATTTATTPAAAANSGGTVGETLSTLAGRLDITISPSMAEEYAAIMCDGLDDGISTSNLVRIGMKSLPRYDRGEHSFLIGSSIGALCPEHAGAIGGGVA